MKPHNFMSELVQLGVESRGVYVNFSATDFGKYIVHMTVDDVWETFVGLKREM